MNTKNYRCHWPLWPSLQKVPLLAFLFFYPNFSFAKPVAITCPDDLTVQLGPGECGMNVVFDTLDWTSTLPLTDTIFFPPSGTFLEIGNNVVTLAVTNILGGLETCTFTVTVNEFFAFSVDCQQNHVLNLNGQCSREIVAEEILVADSSGCAANYEVIRLTNTGLSLPPFITANDLYESFLVVVKHEGNGMQCLSQVTVLGGIPPSFTCPPNAVILCNEPGDSSNTGSPIITGCFQDLVLEYFDETNVTFCPDSVAYQTIRTWVATDPFGQKDTCEQLITAYRYDVNQIDFPTNHDGVFNSKLQCIDSLSVEEMTAPSITGFPTFLQNPVDGGLSCKVSAIYTDDITSTCTGTYDIFREWSVVKICAPSITLRDTQLIQIVDTIAPVFQLPDTIFVSQNAACADSIFLPPAANIQECSDVDFEIRTPWDTLLTNGGWTVLQLTSGTYPVIYSLTDECGNTSMDTSLLLIENETLVSCPPDTSVSCEYYFDTLIIALIVDDSATLAKLGMPVFHANCEFSVVETDSFLVDACGNGFLLRALVSTSTPPQVCVQEVTIQHYSDFDVVFPADISLCSAPTLALAGFPVTGGVSCEVLTIENFDDVQPGDINGCYTIHRTWRVTNSCAFDGDVDYDDTEIGPRHFADGGDGFIEYLQIIEVSDTEGPVFPDGCEIADQFVPANGCEIEFTLPIPAVLGCGDFDLFVGGNLGNVLGANVDLGPGTYGVNYTAIDACGEGEVCSTFFEVRDTVGPVVACKAGLTLELFPSICQAQAFAQDFILSATDNCGGQLDFSFTQFSPEYIATFDCENSGQNLITIWVTDENNNQNNCSTFVNIIDGPFGSCDCGLVEEALLSGTIKTEENEGIKSVAVAVESSNGPNPVYYTSSVGDFEISVSAYGEDYTLTPTKNTNITNGVTTFDALQITKHVLGTLPLSSPYKIIAADINNSGNVSTFDALLLRKVILFIDLEFQNNTSWRFVSAAYVFPDPTDPFDSGWPEIVNINNVTDDVLGIDFIGIKVGDLNSSANTQE